MPAYTLSGFPCEQRKKEIMRTSKLGLVTAAIIILALSSALAVALLRGVGNAEEHEISDDDHGQEDNSLVHELEESSDHHQNGQPSGDLKDEP